jgi:hypothetical protein
VALLQLRRVPRALGHGGVRALIFGVVLTASRTGLVSVGCWRCGACSTAACRASTRALLLAAPLLYALAWFGMARWAEVQPAHLRRREARLAETDISGSRFGIWGNTLALIGPALDGRGLRRIQPRLVADALSRPADRLLRPHAQPAAAAGWWNWACRWPAVPAAAAVGAWRAWPALAWRAAATTPARAARR